MARTKAEIRQWLDNQVGSSLAKPNGEYRGECVSFIQQLLAFLGASSGNDAMGNAKDFDNALLSKGIANNGPGWLNIAVNPFMGGGYGHIWVDVSNEFNIEQNGAVGRTVTKNTRPISYARQLVNLDKWIAPDNTNNQTGESTMETLKSMYWRLLGREADAGGLQHHSANVSSKGWEFVYNDLKNSTEGQNDWNWRNPDRVRQLETANNQKDGIISDLKTALANEQAKPPKEVIKEVEKIVEKPVEVPVYTHDKETKDNVNKILAMVTSIFDYFSGQYKSFKKYIKKG
jgi:hypothetical protein